MVYIANGYNVNKYNDRTGLGKPVLVVLPTNCTKKFACEMAEIIADKLNEGAK